MAELQYARRPGPETLALLATVAREALRDAQLEPGDVDGLAVASFTLAPDHAADVAWRLGLRLRWLMEDTNGGASGLNMQRTTRSPLGPSSRRPSSRIASTCSRQRSIPQTSCPALASSAAYTDPIAPVPRTAIFIV